MGTAAWFDLVPGTFHFLNPGVLRSDELELVAPEQRWIDDLLIACSHPLTRRNEFAESRITRSQVGQFLRQAPFGHEPADPSRGRVPTYHFWMYWHNLPGDQSPPIRIAGGISLRIGASRTLELYYGHVGYHVYPPARGRHFAERACRLLLPLAAAHGFHTLWLTCNPDNHASRRTCERLGATLVEIVPVPMSDPLYERGDYEKCRYRIDLR